MQVDVLIVGGGPAGGMTALLFARAGMSVALCEAHAVLPERVCGMYLCPAGVAMLDRLGLRERVGAGARRLRGMIMVAPNLQRLETYFPSVGDMPDYGLAMPRPQLDNALLEAARAAGAVVVMAARPTKIRSCGDGWVAELADHDPIEARLLVGADGRKSSTARLLGVSLPVRRSRAAVHMDCPARMPTLPMGQMHVFDDGTYAGLDALTPDVVNLSMVCDPDTLRGISVVEFVNDHIARSPYLSELVDPLPTDAKPGVTFPTNARVRTAATHNAALVGDASGYVDPLTGEGIFGAIWTAEELVKAVTGGWSELPLALHRYANARAQRQRAKSVLCELFQFAIRRPWLANSIQWLLSRQQPVADSFIGIVGNSYSPARGFVRIAQHALAL